MREGEITQQPSERRDEGDNLIQSDTGSRIALTLHKETFGRSGSVICDSCTREDVSGPTQKLSSDTMPKPSACDQLHALPVLGTFQPSHAHLHYVTAGACLLGVTYTRTHGPIRVVTLRLLTSHLRLPLAPPYHSRQLLSDATAKKTSTHMTHVRASHPVIHLPILSFQIYSMILDCLSERSRKKVGFVEEEGDLPKFSPCRREDGGSSE